ncbi:hypothetical protein GQP67_004381 [Salmonella enterica]|nr:hypothetical protein [Salmonella enterica]
MSVYAVNMMYACGECSVYKIFELERGRFLYKRVYLDSGGKDKTFMQKAYKIRGVDSQSSNSLIGTEFYIAFSGHEGAKFKHLEGKLRYTGCYVFYFKGVLTNKYNLFHGEYKLLTVSDYKIIPDRNCIREGNLAENQSGEGDAQPGGEGRAGTEGIGGAGNEDTE